MRLALALGAAVAALTAAAAAADNGGATRVIVRHGPEMRIDADRDGWITRAEAAAAAERMFDEMDRNDDSRLTEADHPRDLDIRVDIPDIDVEELEGEDGERRVRVIRRGVESERIEREVERALERAEREIEQAERHAERATREAERAEREVRRHVNREVIVIHGGGHGQWTAPVPPVPPVPPIPPHPPLFMMMVASSEEADLNGDGALSRDEFRAQQLRFFDASDANGDGRIRFEPPPEPPAPPAPPEPPR